MTQIKNVDNIIVCGKSGAGKQPRIDVLIDHFGMEQLSTGNIFREFMGKFDDCGYKGDISTFFDDSSGSGFVPDEEIISEIEVETGKLDDPDSIVLGLKAKANVNAGRFVPDSLTNSLFMAYFARGGYRGFVLDGYPRTPEQARFLLKLAGEKNVGLDLLVEVDNEDGQIIKRTVGRRICSSCGKVYHVQYKPSGDNIHCDICGGVLKQRSDDTEERIRSRLEEFYRKVIPAMEILRSEGVPKVVVPGNLEVFTEENVRRSVLEAVLPALEKRS